jgi:hypothetical protein
MTPEEHENYIGSDEFKKELKVIIVCMAILAILAVVVIITKSPHYTPDQLYCIKMHPDTRYLCGV